MHIDVNTQRCVTMGNPEVTSRYFRDMRRLEKPLGSEEQKELIVEYKATGDVERKKVIRDKILLSNQAFIVSMARHLSNGNDFNDLISEGNIGMLKAIDNFNPDNEQNVKFLTYAVYNIIKSMKDYRNFTNPMIKTGSHSRVTTYSEPARNKYFVTNGWYPTAENLQDELKADGVTIANKEDLYEITVSSIDGFSDCNDNTDVTWFDSVCYDKLNENDALSDVSTHMENLSIKALCEKSLSYLEEDERKLLCYYFGIGGYQLSPMEIAEKLKIKGDKKKIQRLVKRYINKIRRNGKIETHVQ